MPKQLRETAIITEEAAAAAKTTGRMLVEFITPGWGSSGYYSPEVLEQAADDVVIPKGTHMYADHPTDTEDHERPGRSIKDLMAVTTEDARLSDTGSLVGEVQVVPAWKDLVETVRDHIGVSIRGSATDIVEGEAEGRRGRIIEGLVAPVLSVDFVTRAGRGGKVLQVLESAAANYRALDHGVEEATVNDTREALQAALRDAHAASKDVYLWVRDFDDSTVWFELDGSGAGDEAGIYGQAYSEADGVVTLSGARAEVRVQTTYVPVTRPDSNTPTTTESLEDNMAQIQIEESEHRGLTEKAGRVDALESENATLKAEKTALEEGRAADQRRARAMDLIREHDHAFSPLEAKGLVAELPVKEGALDEEAFGTQLAEHAAAVAQASGAGRITSMGATTDTATATESAPTRTTTAWGRPVSEQKGA